MNRPWRVVTSPLRVIRIIGDHARILPPAVVLVVLLIMNPMTTFAQEDGIIQVLSARGPSETVERLIGSVRAKGLIIFAHIDFAADAERAGLKMPLTQLVIFGNPRAGTMVMLAAPSVALDLPLRVLVSVDANGATWLSYNDPSFLGWRHAIPAPLLGSISGVGSIVNEVAR